MDGTDNKPGSTKKGGRLAPKVAFAVALGLPLLAFTTIVVKADLDQAQSAVNSRTAIAASAQTGRDFYDRAQADDRFMKVLPQMTLGSWKESHSEADLSATLDAEPLGRLYRLMPSVGESLKTAKEYDALSNDPINTKIYPAHEAFMQVNDACKLVDEIKKGTPEQDLTAGARALSEPKNFDAELQYCGADPAVYKPKFDKLRAVQEQQMADSIMAAGAASGTVTQ